MKLGYDESGSGAVLLLIHGFPVDRNIWAEQLSGLSDLRRVVAVDLRGRGKSQADVTVDWTIDDYAEDIAETIDSLGVRSADLAGLSMGGFISFALLRRHPSKVRSLILISTKAEADSEEAKAARDETAALVREKGTGALVDRMLGKVLAEGASEAIKRQVVKMIQAIPAGSAAADSLAMRDRPDSTPDLASITIPATVIQGEEDQLMTLDAGREMAGRIPGCSFVSIAGAGHFAPLENPDAVNQALRQLLSSIST